ncbi:MAG: VWA domain-containing protein [Phycisphaerae bacterium]|nr:VWA domain-containing protein [Phycisphaerae bacterium]
MPAGTTIRRGYATSTGVDVAAADTASASNSRAWLRFDDRTLIGAWGLSLLVHLAALVVMLLLVFPFEANRAADLPVTQIEFVSEPTATVDERASSNAFAKPVEPTPKPVEPRSFTPLSELTVKRKPELSILAIGSGGGDLGQYGLTGGSSAAPQFFGLGGTARAARSVVYVVDRSGSMVDTFSYVKAELKRSITALRRSQKFHVIFFSDGEPLENPPHKLVSAIEAQKKAFFEFMDQIDAAGSTHPEQSMRRALALEPDVVYFLTDGEFDRRLVDLLDRWNEDRRVQIFTIAYFDPAGAELLEHIAREHGGEFKYVTENDLP